MLDIDHFKRCNDTYGHDAGDMLLRALGAVLLTYAQDTATACRYGGEEFILVLPGTSLDVARQRAEEIRIAIHELAVNYQRYTLAAVTLSLGVAAFPDHGVTADDLIKAADYALYQAKREGRNRVVVADWHVDYAV
jgi:diguanylate cyclase (GGDEF)-like protein